MGKQNFSKKKGTFDDVLLIPDEAVLKTVGNTIESRSHGMT